MTFLNLNEQIFYMQGGTDQYRVIEAYRFLGGFALPTLLKVKWVLTVLFAFLFLFMSLLALHFVFQREDMRRWLLWLYGLGVVVSGLSFVIGSWSGSPDLGYTIARAVMGALQSPFPLMLMIPLMSGKV